MFQSSRKYQAGNADPATNNPQVLQACLSEVRQKIHREMTIGEERVVLKVFKTYASVNFQGIDPKTIVPTMVSVMLTHLRKYQDRQLNPTDMHKYLKSKIGKTAESDNVRDMPITDMEIIPNGDVGVSQIFGTSEEQKIQRYFNPKALYRTRYIVLDSKYRSLTTVSTKLYWPIVEGQYAPDATSIVGRIRSIVMIKVYQFRIPYFAGRSDSIFNRISLLFDELSSQSFVCQESRLFHIMLQPTVNGRWTELDPEHFNKGIFRFYQPITKLDSLTVTMGDPLRLIDFGMDRVNGSLYIKPDRGSGWVGSYFFDPLVTELTINTTSNHGLQTGDEVVLSNVSPIISSLNIDTFKTLNSNNGNIVIKISDTSFSINTLFASYCYHPTGTSLTTTISSNTVTGVGTHFPTDFRVGQTILLFIPSSFSGLPYTIHSIESDTSLTIETTATSTGTVVVANVYAVNFVRDAPTIVYFNSKRIIIPIEVTYLASDQE